MNKRLGIVTATTDHQRARACIHSWHQSAAEAPMIALIENGGIEREYLGTVPAFRRGVDQILAEYPQLEVICCFHDDLELTERGWDQRVLRLFDEHPACGLAGFGGALRLGADRLYEQPYDPMLLARGSFRSNLRDAEAHGIRSLVSERVVCLDGFSQIGRRAFWEGRRWHPSAADHGMTDPSTPRPWSLLEDLGVVHHAYDAMLGCLSRRYGWETWYLPVACVHYGGQTAVGDSGYGDWARTRHPKGDQGFWESAHRICYDNFRDALPLRV